MPEGIKHLIQCHCILPQYKNSKDPVFHKFVVFSIIDDSDTCIPKIANCNNCGASHKVYDICKSELLTGSEDLKTAMKKEDFKLSLVSSVYELLEQYGCEIYDFEYAQFIIDNQKWDSTISLTKENISDKLEGKLLRFISENKFRVESFSYTETVDHER